jgi:DNA ligase (NAD+)
MTYDELKALVIKHCHLYYNLSMPEISDAEFDKLYDDLEAVEKAQGWVAYDSPTAKVGGAAGKVTHPIKLYSLRKVYDAAEVDDFYDVQTPKIDGANLTLVYKRGKLSIALTRGNGEMGDNIIHLASGITNIPQRIQTDYDQIVINGECVTDNTVENFRNYVSGALGLKSLTEFRERSIKFIAHDLLGISMNYTTRMTIVQNMGFATVLDKNNNSYPRDGVVFRVNDYKKSMQMGYTSKYPRFAVALKPRELNTVRTTLQDVIWVIGRTGTVNPTGIVSPVVIEDATISRVTLHNIGIIEEYNLGLGDTIEIERAGGVIPKFLRVIEHSAHGIKITEKHAEAGVGTKVMRDGPRLLVSDKSIVNTSKVMEHFVKTMEIKGLGPANIEKMGITHPSELYEEDQWDNLGAVGAKIEEEISKSKNKPYETVLAALGIPGVGKSTAKLIVQKIPTFRNLKDIQYVDIKGIGPSTIDSILTWLEENEEWVQQLPLQLEQTISVSELISTTLRKVCITGKMDMTRTELADTLEKLGYKVTSTVTKDCYALITGGDTSSSKYLKAKQLDITVVDYWSSKKDVLAGNF